MQVKRKKIRSVWKEYLTLSMRERRGLSILLSILLFQLIFLFYLNNIDLNYPYPDLNTVKNLQDGDESTENIARRHQSWQHRDAGFVSGRHGRKGECRMTNVEAEIEGSLPGME